MTVTGTKSPARCSQGFLRPSGAQGGPPGFVPCDRGVSPQLPQPRRRDTDGTGRLAGRGALVVTAFRGTARLCVSSAKALASLNKCRGQVSSCVSPSLLVPPSLIKSTGQVSSCVSPSLLAPVVSSQPVQWPSGLVCSTKPLGTRSLNKCSGRVSLCVSPSLLAPVVVCQTCECVC